MPKFNDIVGQKQIREHLETAVMQGTSSHAYIISGEKYMGKKFIAGIFAAALLCEDENERPCGKCHSCSQAGSFNNPDIIYVTHEKPNIIGVDDIREQVNSDVCIKPYAGKKKIYIIDEAEKMNPQAQNALLKTFEEPPEYAVIILLVTNEEELLPTIRSRAVVLNMKPVPDDMLKRYLMEQEQVPDYKADICVAFARGNLGKALRLIVNEKFDTIREDAFNLLKKADSMDTIEIMAMVKKVSSYKEDISEFFDIITVWYRDVLMFKATQDANNLIFKEEIQYIKKVAQNIGYDDVQAVLDAVETARKRLSSNVNFDLTMELLFLTIQER